MVLPPQDHGCVRAARADGDDGRVFILYAVVAGLVIGVLTGGSAARLGDLRFRWAPLIVARAGRPGAAVLDAARRRARAGRARSLTSPRTVAVLVAVWRNLAIPGLPLVLIGGASNLIAIVANGGYMPVSPGALAGDGPAAARRATRTAASSTASSSVR